jgi:hypothetical protein
MALFMATHRAPGLLQEQWQDNALEVYNGDIAKFVHAYVNLSVGFIVTIYEAASADDLEEQLEIYGFPFEEIHEIEFSQSYEEMEGMLKGLGKI